MSTEPRKEIVKETRLAKYGLGSNSRPNLPILWLAPRIAAAPMGKISAHKAHFVWPCRFHESTIIPATVTMVPTRKAIVICSPSTKTAPAVAKRGVVAETVADKGAPTSPEKLEQADDASRKDDVQESIDKVDIPYHYTKNRKI